ncbi:unnamed protein product [marine sediment metagenome]|uniref:Uncharacterized protein n=1 Tax=marine sediment metagenome TaxID=412755 RepID=X1L5M8_9ZZZZ
MMERPALGYWWNDHYNATEVSPFPTTWKHVKVSNPTPHPWDPITVTGELWYYLGGPADPTTTGVALVIDEHVVARTTLGPGGKFSLTIGAPPVPGPYTYWPCVVYDLRYDGAVFLENHGPPIGIEVIPLEEPDKLKRYLLLGVIGIEVVVGLVWLLKGR